MGRFESNIGEITAKLGASLGFLLGLMDDRLLNPIGVMAPRIVLKLPVHIFERRASAVQGRGQLIH